MEVREIEDSLNSEGTVLTKKAITLFLKELESIVGSWKILFDKNSQSSLNVCIHMTT